MRPLFFLWYRTFINGIRRAFSSPRRIIGTLFFFSYYLLMFRPFWGGRDSNLFRATAPFGGAQQFDFPPLDAIEALVFGGFVALTLILALGLFSYRGGFKPADVDVLFPTPISPKKVMLFRLGRDYLLTLIVPLFLALFAYRPVSTGWTALFRNFPHPEYAGLITRTIVVAWLLTSLAWVAMGYAASLYFGRPEPQYDRRRHIAYAIFGALMISVPGVVIWQAFHSNGVADLIHLAQSGWLRGFFFLATGATDLAMSPLQGSWQAAAIGAFVLLGTILISILAALSQSRWLYEQSTMKTTDAARARQLQMRGDMYGMLAERARAGQIKAGKRGWFHKLRVQGPRALLWKEFLLQLRTSKAILLLFPFVTAAMALMPVLASRHRDSPVIGYTFLGMVLMGVFMLTTIVSQSGYVELLKRVDFLKPLPFKPSMTMFVEVTARTLLSVALCLPGPLLVMIVAPSLWHFGLAALIMLPPTALLVSAYLVVILLLFPDLDDPTQRGFRGLVMMLGLIVLFGPSVGVFAGLSFLKVTPFLAALPVAAINIGLSIFAAIMAGNLYTSFNPSE